MNNYYNKIFCTFVILFFVSCVSSRKKNEFLKADAADLVHNVVKVIQDRCYNAKNPQFLGEFSTGSMKIAPYEMEGVWENNYNLLKASVIGPLGEEYLSFSVDGYKVNYNNSSRVLVDNDYFAQISSLIASMGAKELRSFLCGQYAFHISDENDGIFIVKETSPELKTENKKPIDNINKVEENELKIEYPDEKVIFNKKYFAISTIQISSYNIEIHSNVSITKNPKGNGFGVIVNSRFFYGPFSNDAQVDVKWVGYINNNNVYPSSTIFRTKEETFSVSFIEYQ
ncbi:hypothetical protein [Silvanigrella aquatica]|uniref:DUF4292 domain-containing protein n=1 Tax=Silvanigrella aquatica TaxID=1915309 RepID=A0A1L4D3H1_9BACT|nr:hypothetical protein [Silvanigrella aquatica]APJ04755.1 hypothetical protein AXG55_12950 [Silvanigrella aquatica]